MQDTNIERYLINDDIYNKMNKQFISLDFDDERIQSQNRHLNEVL